MILDGWGNGDHTKSDVIYSTNPEYINAMTAQYPHAELKTDGEKDSITLTEPGKYELKIAGESASFEIEYKIK